MYIVIQNNPSLFHSWEKIRFTCRNGQQLKKKLCIIKDVSPCLFCVVCYYWLVLEYYVGPRCVIQSVTMRHMTKEDVLSVCIVHISCCLHITTAFTLSPSSRVRLASRVRLGSWVLSPAFTHSPSSRSRLASRVRPVNYPQYSATTNSSARLP